MNYDQYGPYLLARYDGINITYRNNRSVLNIASVGGDLYFTSVDCSGSPYVKVDSNTRVDREWGSLGPSWYFGERRVVRRVGFDESTANNFIKSKSGRRGECDPANIDYGHRKVHRLEVIGTLPENYQWEFMLSDYRLILR